MSYSFDSTAFDNFTNLSFMARTFHEIIKQNVELCDSYRVIIDTFFESSKNLYLQYLDKVEERSMSYAFFISHNMQKELDKVDKVKKEFKSEVDRDKTLFSLYF